MKKETAKIMIYVFCAFLILLAIFSPKTSYVKYDRTVSIALLHSHTLNFKFYKDIPEIKLYKDVWTKGELISSEVYLQGSPADIKSIIIRENTLSRYPEQSILDLELAIGYENTTQTLDLGEEVFLNPSGLGRDVLDDKRKTFLEPNQTYILYMYTVGTGDGFLTYAAPINAVEEWKNYWQEDERNSYVVIRLET